MGRPFLYRAAWSLAAASVIATALVAQVPAGKRAAAAASPARTRAFSLSAGAAAFRFVRLTAGRVECPIVSYGLQCISAGYVEGSFWPRGTGDNYVYQGGLQIAATIPSSAGFEWAGDTVGAYFMDARGDQRVGDGLTGVYNSLNANDLANWPTAAYANDPALFSQNLLGRAAVSDQDTWTRYWDGEPSLSAGRRHLMGVVVDQRTMSWNRPSHQDIVYLLFRVINITSRLPASYAGLSSIGYTAADQQQLADLGALFQARAESLDATLQIPDSGYAFSNLYVAYNQDPDVGNASFNFSTAVLPFSLVAAMKTNYAEPQWAYPPDIFGAPFAQAPGFEAIEVLRGAADSGGGRSRIAVWSNTGGAIAGLNDPVGTSQLYRYLSGRPVAAIGDGSCNSDPNLLHTCVALQAVADTRYFESTGPATLAPGHALLFAVAMVYAAPLAQWAATSNGIYAMPAGQLSTYVGSGSGTPSQTFFPGWPATAETLAVAGTGGGARVCTTNCGKTATIRDPVERAMGWGQFSDANGDGRIEATEVQTVPGSLLHKAQVAQALFDDKFLLPAAPDAPRFFLVPGDNAVTVAWEKSATETTGDPYYPLTQDPTSPLYDPDYRQNDVLGYRIWRGTSPANLRPIAEFAYLATFTDYTGQIVDLSVYGNQCAPELGVTASCPPFPVQYPVYGRIAQVPLGGRILAQDGSVVLLRADTVSLRGCCDVSFVFADSTIKNGFTYYYAVTVFDLNSVRSGPPSLESPLAPKMATPRVGSGQETAGALGAAVLLGADGTVLTGTMPKLDSATGEFAGPMPPTDAIGIGLLSFLPQVVDSGNVTVAIDSIQPGDGWSEKAGTYFYTVQSARGATPLTASVLVDLTYGTGYGRFTFPALQADAARTTRFGGDSAFTMVGNLQLQWAGTWDVTNWGRASANYYPSYGQNLDLNGPRWWVGTPNENTANPNGGACSPGVSTCGSSTPVPNLARTAGSLGAGVQVMLIEGYATVPWEPMRQIHAMTSYLARAADFKVYWGSAGAVDSVVDVTHHVPVPFSPVLRASWGLLTDQSFASTIAALTPDQSNAVLRWDDVTCIAPIPTLLTATGSITAAQGCGGAAQAPAVLMRTAHLSPVVFGSSAFGAPASAATGSGFIFYVAGQFFLMQMAALPSPGTIWNLRTYAGNITGGPGTFAFVGAGGAPICDYCSPPLTPPAVPGLRMRISYTGSVFTPGVSNAAELASVHTVPDPYYNHDTFETVGGPRQIHFVNLPARCIIRIYSASGILVRVLTHNDPTGGGETVWDVTNRGGALVASGVYFYHVEAPDGKTKVGRLTIVNMTAN